MKLSFGNLANTKKIITIIIIVLILLSIPIAVFLVQQRQEIRKKAAGEERLICYAGEDWYNSNSIQVTNNTGLTVSLTIQENECPYEGQTPSRPYECNTFKTNYTDTILTGQSKTFTKEVPDCKIGQLDIITSTVCYVSTDSDQTWEGNLAYAIKANPTGYDQATGTCPAPTPTNTPTPIPSGTPPPTNTPTPIPSGTPPIGEPPTNTPTPTRTPTPIPTNSPTPTPIPTATPTAPPGSTPTPTTPPPVSGTGLPTILTIAGGLILVVVALLL